MCLKKKKVPYKLFVCLFILCLFGFLVLVPRSEELRTQHLKSHLMRAQCSKVPLKPRVGQYIAMYATLTARDFFRADF